MPVERPDDDQWMAEEPIHRWLPLDGDVPADPLEPLAAEGETLPALEAAQWIASHPGRRAVIRDDGRAILAPAGVRIWKGHGMNSTPMWDYQDDQVWLRLERGVATPGPWPRQSGPVAGTPPHDAARLAFKESWNYRLHPVLWWRLREAIEAGQPVGIRTYASYVFAGRLIDGGNILYSTDEELQPWQTAMPR